MLLIIISYPVQLLLMSLIFLPLLLTFAAFQTHGMSWRLSQNKTPHCYVSRRTVASNCYHDYRNSHDDNAQYHQLGRSKHDFLIGCLPDKSNTTGNICIQEADKIIKESLCFTAQKSIRMRFSSLIIIHCTKMIFTRGETLHPIPPLNQSLTCPS